MSGISAYRRYGFTLLEMVMVIGLIGLISAIAIPSYRQFTARVARSEALQQMYIAAACQERHYASHGEYDAAACSNVFQSSRYSIAFEADTGPQAFLINAVPAAGQSIDRCGTLGLNHAGMRTISGDSGLLAECWEGR